MAKFVERTVLVRESDFGSFLDMLRYDGCTVVQWTAESRGSAPDRPDRLVYQVTLRSGQGRTPGYEFTVDRWRSFGINISEPTVRSY